MTEHARPAAENTPSVRVVIVSDDKFATDPESGIMYCTSALWRRMHDPDQAYPDSSPRRLSPKQEAVLRCLMRGCSNKQIAREIGISEATVKVHVKAILKVMNVHNRTQAAVHGEAFLAADTQEEAQS